MRIRVLGALVAAIPAVWNASPAEASRPEITVEEFNVSGVSGNLSAACGVEVFRTATGRVLFQRYDGPDGVLEIAHFHTDVVASSEFGEVRFPVRSIEKLFITPDGTSYLLIAGQGPFGMHGRLLLDVTVEEFVVREAAKSIDEAIAELCTVLNPA